MISTPLAKRLALAATLVAGFAFVATTVDARPGRGGNVGSRGERTYAPPPPTATAPRPTQGMDRSVTQAPRPATPAQQAQGQARPGMGMGAGLLGGFAAGFLGAGLFGMLSGAGFFAGLGTFAGLMGLLIQVLLIAGGVYLILRFMRARREQPAGGPALERVGGLGAGPGHGLGTAAIARKPQPIPVAPRDGVGLQAQDFETFERMLGDIQAAYGRGDVGALRLKTTPEMAAYFEGELADVAARGLSPRIDQVKLLSGDLAEAWREGSIDYATVAMRYTLVDRLVDARGRVVEGAETPVEVTEIWTFARQPSEGRGWHLGAIQQA